MTMLMRPPQRSCAGSVCESFAMIFLAAARIDEGQKPLEHEVQCESAPEIARKFGPGHAHDVSAAPEVAGRAC